uniref:Uncharacterized protein n=1 Tax=Anopheles quadriannulatus TaxID=34691 RepID=A0A182XTQ7_ANOQN
MCSVSPHSITARKPNGTQHSNKRQPWQGDGHGEEAASNRRLYYFVPFAS